MLLMTFDTPQEQDLFDDLYDKYNNLLYKRAFEILKKESDTEDALQNAYCKILKYFYRVKNIDEAKRLNFIITVVRNSAIDIYNKRKNEICIADDEVMINISGMADANISEFQNLKLILGEIDQKYRAVITLKYTYGYTNSEIADILGISESNVAVRLHRAKQKLREELERR